MYVEQGDLANCMMSHGIIAFKKLVIASSRSLHLNSSMTHDAILIFEILNLNPYIFKSKLPHHKIIVLN